MNLKLDWQTVAKAVKGRLLAGDGNRPFDSFATDSRKISGGRTFWALKGKKHDAHAFLEDTLKKGASGWIIEKGSRPSRDIGKPQSFAESKGRRGSRTAEHVIEVSDTLKALHALAAFHRRRFDIPIAAITGSNGKSTTKEMLGCICAQRAGTCSNPGSLNNQFGLPLSILELETGRHAYGVFELGASRKGDILEIAGIARPTAGVLTNIAPAHLEFFRDMETIYRTKTELLEFIQPEGTLVYNADDPFLSRLDTAWKSNRLTFGFSKTADIRIMDGPETFELVCKGGTHSILLPSLMRCNRLNAAAAAAAALAMGIDWESIITGLKKFRPLPMRMQMVKKGDASIFLDTYNANPESMRAAVSSILEQYPSASGDRALKDGSPVTEGSRPSLESSGSRTSSRPSPEAEGSRKAAGGPICVILGDMKELGDYSRRYHQELGSWLAGLRLDRIFLAGTEMKAAAEAAAIAGAAGRLTWGEAPEHWMEKLRRQLSLGGTYLIKASRVMQFEKILDKL